MFCGALVGSLALSLSIESSAGVHVWYIGALYANKGNGTQGIAGAVSLGAAPICGGISCTLELQSLFPYSWHYYMSMDILYQYTYTDICSLRGFLRATTTREPETPNEFLFSLFR